MISDRIGGVDYNAIEEIYQFKELPVKWGLKHLLHTGRNIYNMRFSDKMQNVDLTVVSSRIG